MRLQWGAPRCLMLQLSSIHSRCLMLQLSSIHSLTSLTIGENRRTGGEGWGEVTSARGCTPCAVLYASCAQTRVAHTDSSPKEVGSHGFESKGGWLTRIGVKKRLAHTDWSLKEVLTGFASRVGGRVGRVARAWVARRRAVSAMARRIDSVTRSQYRITCARSRAEAPKGARGTLRGGGVEGEEARGEGTAL